MTDAELEEKFHDQAACALPSDQVRELQVVVIRAFIVDRRGRRHLPNPISYHAVVSGFLTEIDRMQLEVREYLNLHPQDLTTAVKVAPDWQQPASLYPIDLREASHSTQSQLEAGPTCPGPRGAPPC
jgi:hypothetical protein